PYTGTPSDLAALALELFITLKTYQQNTGLNVRARVGLNCDFLPAEMAEDECVLRDVWGAVGCVPTYRLIGLASTTPPEPTPPLTPSRTSILMLSRRDPATDVGETPPPSKGRSVSLAGSVQQVDRTNAPGRGLGHAGPSIGAGEQQKNKKSIVCSIQ
ncbi:hypothetical protein HK104_003724, partial [Borealophlyctis nickersoniae]